MVFLQFAALVPKEKEYHLKSCTNIIKNNNNFFDKGTIII